jgi:Protein of unknown function (DUF2750).
MMSKLKQYKPIPKDLFFKISILKTMMYCGVLWGLYHQQGWAMTSDQDHIIFPFWLNGIQAHKYAKKHWPNYTPRRITPEDFEASLLPTLTRLKVIPALHSSSHIRLKLTTSQMRLFFFNQDKIQMA